MPYVEAGHELAHHGWTHRLPVTLSREEEEEEIVRGNESIKRVSGQTRPRLPLARLGSLAALHRTAAEARHPLRQFDDGPRLRLLLRPPGRRRRACMKPFVRGRETALARDADQLVARRLPALRIHAPAQWLGAAGPDERHRRARQFRRRLHLHDPRPPDFGILTYTFHPHVIGRGHRMMMLERLIQRLMRRRRGVHDDGRGDGGMAGA